MPRGKLSAYVAAIDPASLCGSTVSTAIATTEITQGAMLTMRTLNEAMESLMAPNQGMMDSQFAMRYGLSRQEMIDRERHEYEREMRRRQMMQYDHRTMSYRPYDDGTDDRLARENDKLRAELVATRQQVETKKAERIKSRDNLIAHYYSMRPARVNA